MTYKERAEAQNMCIARVKAIDILEFLQDKRIKDDITWYALEDELLTIIESE